MTDTATLKSIVLQPGIQLSLNEKGQVINVESMTTTADAILDQLHLLHLNVKTAIVLTVQQRQRLGYTFGGRESVISYDPFF